MQVVMISSSRAPSFVDEWTRAASLAADVVALKIGPERGQIVGAVPTYFVPRLPRTPNVLGPVVSHVMVRRLRATIERIEADHGRVDLLHGHFYTSVNLPPLSRRTRIPYVLTEHSSRLTGSSAAHKPFTARGRAAAERVYRGSHRVLAVSRFLADCICRLGLPGTVEVVGPPVDVGLFHPRAPTSSTVLPIVSVGRLEEDKDPLLLLESFSLAVAVEPRLRLELIGDGISRETVRRFVRAQHLEQFVSLSGSLPRAEVAARVGTARAFVLASKIETFCLAAAEALAAGVPVVMPRVGAVPELLDERFGILLDGRDPADLADAIVRAVHPSAPFDGVAMAAHIARRFSYDAVADRLRGIYEEACDARVSEAAAAEAG